MKTLGEADAICAYAMLGVHRLNAELAEQTDSRKWLTDAGQKNGIVLQAVHEERLPLMLTQMFIVTVHRHWEHFLWQLIEEAGLPKKEEDKDSVENHVLKSVKLLFSSEVKCERALTNYYRLVRNKALHATGKRKDADELESARNKAIEEVDHTKGGLNPNEFRSLNYHDYQLFTRAVKILAVKCCEFGRPNDTKIGELLETPDYAQLKRFKNKPKRYRNALAQQLRMDFSLEKDEAQVIIDLFCGG